VPWDMLITPVTADVSSSLHLNKHVYKINNLMRHKKIIRVRNSIKRAYKKKKTNQQSIQMKKKDIHRLSRGK